MNETLTAVCRENLLNLAKTFAKAEGLSLSQVSKRCYGNASFLDDFKAGGQSVSFDKLDRMLDWFAENWPKGVDRPVLRPLFMRLQKNGRKIS